MKKPLIALVVVALLLGLGYAFLYVNGIRLSQVSWKDLNVKNVENLKNLQHMTPAGMAAQKALMHWDGGDYTSLYAMLAEDVRHVLPLEGFEQSRNKLIMPGMLRPKIEAIEESGAVATVTATTENLDIKSLTADIFARPQLDGSGGDLGKKLERQTVLLELVDEGGSWKVSQFDPVTIALRKMEEARKASRDQSQSSAEVEGYKKNILISDLRAQAITTYGPEPFIVGLISNKGNRTILKLGIKFTIRNEQGKVLLEDLFHPVVESSISSEEQPLDPQSDRKISYQLDRAPDNWRDTRNVTAEIMEVKLAPASAGSAAAPDDAKSKLKKAREREGA